MTNDDWQNCVGSRGGAPFLPPFPDPMPYGYSLYNSQNSAACNVNPYYPGSIQSQLGLIMGKLTRLEAENEELKKTVSELVQSRYFD